MAYPEPIPELSEKEWDEFQDRLANFSLSEEQRAFYSDALSFLDECTL